MHTQQTEQNHWLDIQLSSSIEYPTPDNAIQLDAKVTTPSGKTITIPGFWRGGQDWCVRYSSADIGEHTLLTQCSDTSNNGLHKQGARIHIKPTTSDNPLLKHGGIKVAADKRHFAHQDDTPFFWLADTWWMGLCGRLSDAEFSKLAQFRAQQGFNTVLLVAGLYPDMPAFDARGKSDSGFAWEPDFKQINPRFFEAADQRIQTLVAQGIVPCILGSWGYYLTWLGSEKMQQHWRHLMARWGALPVIWISSGEQTMPWYLTPETTRAAVSATLKDTWSTVMQSMHKLNGHQRLISAHPLTSARDSVNAISLIDFEMQQTGHDQPTQHHAQSALAGWHAQPSMPVISGESRYEALAITPPVTTADARQAFWAHLIHSGLSGHTYGANGIWQVNQTKQAFGDSPGGNRWGDLSWQEAMHLPGAQQLAIAKSFIETLPWHALYTYTLQHRPSLREHWYGLALPGRIKNCLKHLLGTRVNTPLAAAKTLDQQFAIYYTISDKSFSVNISPFKAPIQAYWFDPSSGEKHTINTRRVSAEQSADFMPIGKNAAGDQDWVLVIFADTDAVKA